MNFMKSMCRYVNILNTPMELFKVIHKKVTFRMMIILFNVTKKNCACSLWSMNRVYIISIVQWKNNLSNKTQRS